MAARRSVRVRRLHRPPQSGRRDLCSAGLTQHRAQPQRCVTPSFRTRSPPMQPSRRRWPARARSARRRAIPYSCDSCRWPEPPATHARPAAQKSRDLRSSAERGRAHVFVAQRHTRAPGTPASVSSTCRTWEFQLTALWTYSSSAAMPADPNRNRGMRPGSTADPIGLSSRDVMCVRLSALVTGWRTKWMMRARGKASQDLGHDEHRLGKLPAPQRAGSEVGRLEHERGAPAKLVARGGVARRTRARIRRRFLHGQLVDRVDPLDGVPAHVELVAEKDAVGERELRKDARAAAAPSQQDDGLAVSDIHAMRPAAPPPLARRPAGPVTATISNWTATLRRSRAFGRCRPARRPCTPHSSAQHDRTQRARSRRARARSVVGLAHELFIGKAADGQRPFFEIRRASRFHAPHGRPPNPRRRAAPPSCTGRLRSVRRSAGVRS